MNDKQVPIAQPESGFWIISPVLHFLAMPALVFWRHNFGYSFLRHKSVFLACGFASILLSYIIFHEPALKHICGDLAAFLVTVSVLYVFHLIRAQGSEWARNAEHDQYSGTSILLNFWAKPQRQHRARLIHTVAEPALTALIGLLVESLGGSGRLGQFLIVSGAALALKEIINSWLTLRREKAFKDKISDVEEMPAPNHPPSPPLKSGSRKQRQPRSRQNARLDEIELRHAQTLRLIPPYTLEAATSNYRLLIKDVHPDHRGRDNATDKFAAELNEAIAYFRENLESDLP